MKYTKYVVIAVIVGIVSCSGLIGSVVNGVAPPDSKQIVQRNGNSVRVIVNATSQDYTVIPTVDFDIGKVSWDYDVSACDSPMLITWDISENIKNLRDMEYWKSLNYEVVAAIDTFTCGNFYTCTVSDYQEVPGFGVYIYESCE